MNTKHTRHLFRGARPSFQARRAAVQTALAQLPRCPPEDEAERLAALAPILQEVLDELRGELGPMRVLLLVDGPTREVLQQTMAGRGLAAPGARGLVYGVFSASDLTALAQDLGLPPVGTGPGVAVLLHARGVKRSRLLMQAAEITT